LTPACAGVLEPKWSALELLKSALNAENFICRLSWSMSTHFVAIARLKCALQPKSGNKIAKNLIKKPAASACYDISMSVYLSATVFTLYEPIAAE